MLIKCNDLFIGNPKISLYQPPLTTNQSLVPINQWRLSRVTIPSPRATSLTSRVHLAGLEGSDVVADPQRAGRLVYLAQDGALGEEEWLARVHHDGVEVGAPRPRLPAQSAVRGAAVRGELNMSSGHSWQVKDEVRGELKISSRHT